MSSDASSSLIISHLGVAESACGGGGRRRGGPGHAVLSMRISATNTTGPQGIDSAARHLSLVTAINCAGCCHMVCAASTCTCRRHRTVSALRAGSLHPSGAIFWGLADVAEADAEIAETRWSRATEATGRPPANRPPDRPDPRPGYHRHGDACSTGGSALGGIAPSSADSVIGDIPYSPVEVGQVRSGVDIEDAAAGRPPAAPSTGQPR